MKQQDVDTLRATIMAEAQRDRQRIVGGAESQARHLREQAEAEASAERTAIVGAAEAKVNRLKQEMVGSAGLEAQAIKVRKRELLLEQVFDLAAEKLATPGAIEDYGAMVDALVAEASEHLGGKDDLVICADMGTLALLDRERLDRLGEVTGGRLSAGPPLLQGAGIVLESADGRLRYDNTFQTRLDRLRAALRSSVYRILVGDEGVA